MQKILYAFVISAITTSASPALFASFLPQEVMGITADELINGAPGYIGISDVLSSYTVDLRDESSPPILPHTGTGSQQDPFKIIFPIHGPLGGDANDLATPLGVINAALLESFAETHMARRAQEKAEADLAEERTAHLQTKLALALAEQGIVHHHSLTSQSPLEHAPLEERCFLTDCSFAEDNILMQQLGESRQEKDRMQMHILMLQREVSDLKKMLMAYAFLPNSIPAHPTKTQKIFSDQQDTYQG